MYLWVGFDVDEQLCMFRERMRQIENDLHFRLRYSEIPFHVSLKIPFLVRNEDFEKAINVIAEFAETLNTFNLSVKGVENENTIVWLRFFDSEYLSKVKLHFNVYLKEKFNIPMHEYDFDSLFHITLFMDEDVKKNSLAYDRISDFVLPKSMSIRSLSIGLSEDGTAGTYKIIRKFELKG